MPQRSQVGTYTGSETHVILKWPKKPKSIIFPLEFYYFLRFGGMLFESKIHQNCVRKRSQNQLAKKSRLGSDLSRIFGGFGCHVEAQDGARKASKSMSKSYGCKVFKKRPSEGFRGSTAEGSRTASIPMCSVLGGPVEVSTRPPGLR